MNLGGKSASIDHPFVRTVAHGLRANWRQFALLVVVNAFVGGMVGLERTVMPLLAERDFGLVSRTAMLSFIVSFGIVKALANLFAGRMSDRIGRKRILAAAYPAVWGIGQLATGALSDRLGRKPLIGGGMWTQAIGVGVIVVARPDWRASAVGVYRLWRDGGYALGALLAGVLADRFGLSGAIATIGALTFASGAAALFGMDETLPSKQQEVPAR